VTFCKNYGIEFVDFALAESKMKAISIISTLAVNNELTKKGVLSSTPLRQHRTELVLKMRRQIFRQIV
jgi:hypothetical protein